VWTEAAVVVIDIIVSMRFILAVRWNPRLQEFSPCGRVRDDSTPYGRPVVILSEGNDTKDLGGGRREWKGREDKSGRSRLHGVTKRKIQQVAVVGGESGFSPLLQESPADRQAALERILSRCDHLGGKPPSRDELHERLTAF
jgi:hypothetical protein